MVTVRSSQVLSCCDFPSPAIAPVTKSVYCTHCDRPLSARQLYALELCDHGVSDDFVVNSDGAYQCVKCDLVFCTFETGVDYPDACENPATGYVSRYGGKDVRKERWLSCNAHNPNKQEV